MNILDRYGIKEVADVTFYDLNADGTPKHPVLYLDTLKVTTIEQTAEETEARGGKGNAALIAWDYGKEINVTIEDALFSAKSMAIMFGNGHVRTYTGDSAYIMKTEQWTASSDGSGTIVVAAKAAGWSDKYTGPDGKLYDKVNPKFYDAEGNQLVPVGSKYFSSGITYFCSYDLKVDGAVIEISANSFPGTYYVTGDTFARAEANGKDEFFQFIIPKAKVQSENTITLEAEGDPSVFNMNLRVLRPADGVMMKLVKYDLDGGETGSPAVSNMYHNHYLDPDNTDGSDIDSIALTIGGDPYTIAKPAAAGANAVTWSVAYATRNDLIGLTNGSETGSIVITPDDDGAAGTATVVCAWNGGYITYAVTVSVA